MQKKLSASSRLLIHIVLIIGTLVVIIPFIWMVLTAGKTLTETTTLPPTIFPENFQWENFQNAWNALPFVDFYINTLFMIGLRVLTSTLFSAMAAFALAKLEFPGKKIFFLMVLTQLMIPPQIFLTPQYLLVQNLGLLDTRTALFIPGIVSAFGTFLLRQYFKQLPDELMEAAVIDGASVWQVFSQVYFPLAKSGLVSLAIFTSITAYKDLMWPLVVNISQDKLTISTGLASLQGQYVTDYPLLMAGAVISILPIVILFIIFQNQFVRGIADTGGK